MTSPEGSTNTDRSHTDDCPGAGGESEQSFPGFPLEITLELDKSSSCYSTVKVLSLFKNCSPSTVNSYVCTAPQLNSWEDEFSTIRQNRQQGSCLLWASLAITANLTSLTGHLTFCYKASMRVNLLVELCMYKNKQNFFEWKFWNMGFVKAIFHQ